MKPVDPDIPDLTRVYFGRNQSPYEGLPARMDQSGTAITCWVLTWKERIRVFLGHPIYLLILTQGDKIQPIKLQVERPKGE